MNHHPINSGDPGRLATPLTTAAVDLRRTKRKAEREIWIRGEHWATAVPRQAGVHGTFYYLCYPTGNRVKETLPSIRKDHPTREADVQIDSRKRARRQADLGAVIPDAEEAIRHEVVRIYNTGVMKSPAVRKAATDADRAAYLAARAAEHDRHVRVREGLESLLARTDITEGERFAVQSIVNRKETY